MYVLDTDHLVILQRERGQDFSRLAQRMNRHPDGTIYLSVASLHEQFLGWHTYLSRAKGPSDLVRGYNLFRDVLEDFKRFAVLPFDDRAAELFISLRKAKVRIGTMDLRIASIALANGFTLLTRNLVDFQQVPDLKVEGWTSGPPR